MPPQADPRLAALDDFDPAKFVPWLTYIPGRPKPARVHRSRGPALSTISGWPYAALYKSGPSGWEFVARKAREDHHGHCSNCGRSTFRDHTFWPNGVPRRVAVVKVQMPDGTTLYDAGTWEYMRGPHRRILDPVRFAYLCESCLARWP